VEERRARKLTGRDWTPEGSGAKLCPIKKFTVRSRKCSKDDERRVSDKFFEIVNYPHEGMITVLALIYDHHHPLLRPFYLFLHFSLLVFLAGKTFLLKYCT